MPSSTSNFKRKLRLPRLFFAEPSEIIPRDYERPIPPLPWRGMTVVVVLVVLAAAFAWELYVRSVGYGPTLNDTEDLWTQVRRRVQPESLVIVGESRPLFDLDLDELEKGLGKRPIQLALAGSCAYPVLADLVNDEKFHGTIICSIVPGMFFAPGGPLVETSEKALKRYRTRPSRNGSAITSGCFWRSVSPFSNRRTSRSTFFSIRCRYGTGRTHSCHRPSRHTFRPWIMSAGRG